MVPQSDGVGDGVDSGLAASPTPYLKKRELHVCTGLTCNNKCVFCLDRQADRFTEGTDGLLVRPGDEHSFRDELSRLHGEVDEVVFTSGEPTLCMDLPRLVGIAREVGFERVLLITNGRMCAYRNFCEELVAAGVTRFNVSIHGSTAKSHQSHTRTKGSFGQTVKALYNLSALTRRGTFTLNTTTVVTGLNYTEVGRILSLIARFRVTDATLIPFIPEGNARSYFKKLFVRYADLAAELLSAMAKAGPLPFRVFIQHLPRCLFPSNSAALILENHIVGRSGALVPRPMKVRGDNCNLCACRDGCEGIWKEYVDQVGWDEFRPVAPGSN